MTTITNRAPRIAEQVPLQLIKQIEKPSPYSVLRACSIAESLTTREMDWLATVSRISRVRRGHHLWLKASDVDFIGIAASGFVKMVRSSTNGSDVTIELFGPGQMFGLYGATDGSGFPFSAIAVTDLSYLRIPRREFLAVYDSSPMLKDYLVRKLAARLQNAHAMVAQLSGSRVESRIAAVLFMVAQSFGRRIDGRIQLDVPLTRQEIGEMAGTTVESTIRTMSRWQKDNLISTDHHYITILHECALAAFSAR